MSLLAARKLQSWRPPPQQNRRLRRAPCTPAASGGAPRAAKSPAAAAATGPATVDATDLLLHSPLPASIPASSDARLTALQLEVEALRDQLQAAAVRQDQTLALLAKHQETIRSIQQQQQQHATHPQQQQQHRHTAGRQHAPAAAPPPLHDPMAAAASPAATRLLLPRTGEPLAAFSAQHSGPSPSHSSIVDRRRLGSYDARFHSTSWAATPPDHRLLPRRIVLVRHAQSKGNVDPFLYEHTPDPSVPLTAAGWQQAMDAGQKLRAVVEADGAPARLFFYTSPYLRCKQTTEGLVGAFEPDQLLGVQEEVQLREQDFGNFQDAEGKRREKLERLRFGRFFYRFPHGESGADVYDRMTMFEDHLVRDINAGRFGQGCTLVLVTHGLAARIFLQRWFHWTVDDFLAVYNPPNAELITLERQPSDLESRAGGPASWVHTKALYRMTDESREHLVGCTAEMCSTSWLLQGGLDAARRFSSH